jgi:hypothetical protein
VVDNNTLGEYKKMSGTEFARSNYALTADTQETEHFLQLSCDGQVLVTVTRDYDEGEAHTFLVFNGDGLDEDGGDLTADHAVRMFPVKLVLGDAWREAVRFAYLHALAKMMIADARDERDGYGLAA